MTLLGSAGINARVDALITARALAERGAKDPARFIHWLPNQHHFLLSQAPCKQIRQGNQWGGKTICALAEVIGRCVGRHPLGDEGFAYPRPGPGFEAWVITDSWSQAVAVMGKIWALLPKDEIDPGTVFEPTRGIRGKNPCILFRNGAILRIKTANQDPKSLATGTIDVALFDEPPPDERVFTEVLARLQSKGGVLLLSYTPVNAPVDYLRQYVKEGRIEDHHSPLTVEACIPVGFDRPFRGLDGKLRDQAWIDALRAQYPLNQIPVVIDGEWEFRAEGAYFEGAWDPLRMVHPNPPTCEVRVMLGIDHGDRPGKQVAVLIVVDEEHGGIGGHPYMYVIDEYVAHAGHSLPEDDARGILAMIRRHGWEWKDVSKALGDRPMSVGRGQQKSNRDLQAQLAKLVGVPRDSLRPRIDTAKRGEGRGAGSVGQRSRWLHQQMARGKFEVHPRCETLIAALPKYIGTPTDPAKDIVDAIVYGLDPYVYGQWKKGAIRPPTRLW